MFIKTLRKIASKSFNKPIKYKTSYAFTLGLAILLIEEFNARYLNPPQIGQDNDIVKNKVSWLLEQDLGNQDLYRLLKDSAECGNKEDVIALCSVMDKLWIGFNNESVGESVLCAIRKGHLDIALYLLEKGAPRLGFLQDDMNHAILMGDVVQVNVLLPNASLIPNSPYTNKSYRSSIPPFYLACRLGYVDIVNLFLTELAARENPELKITLPLDVMYDLVGTDRIPQNIHQKMHLRVDHLACLDSLIAYGLDIHGRLGDYDSPLQLAVQNNYIAMTRLLIAHGAKDDLRIKEPHTIFPSDRSGFKMKYLPSILMLISEKNLSDMAILLINNGAMGDINETFHYEKRKYHTALSWAALHGSSEVANILIKSGASKTQACELLGWPNLVWEVATQNVESLSNYIARIDVQDEEHRLSFATEIAVKLNRPEALKVLIAAGANVNHIYDFNRTLAYFAAEDGHNACLQILINANADVNVMDYYANDWHFDPVRNAMRNNHYDCVDTLLATPNLKMSAFVKDPYYLRRLSPTPGFISLDSYQEQARYYAKLNARYEEIGANNRTVHLTKINCE